MTLHPKLALCLAATGLIVASASAEPADNGGRKLSASLTGAAEIPGPGDANGTGTAKITVNHGQKRVCYELTVANIEAATMAHIHAGAVGIAGPVVVTLAAPSDGDSSGCADVSGDLAMNLIQSPGDYYVNVHNAPFPSGAVRGQLAK